jgi:sulfonate transport system permease protein
VLEGIGIGLPAGLLLAGILAWNPYLRRVFYLPVEILRMVPLLAVAPLFVLWFGGAEIGNVGYVVFGISVMMVVFGFSAIRNVAPVYMQFAATLGASKVKIYRSVILPATVPEVLGGVRVAVGFSWAIVLGAELLTAPTGLGRLMETSLERGVLNRMIVILALYMLFAFVLDRIIARGGRWLTVWMS